ncbi:larval cuticle protein 65Ag1-like [Anopheles marshallii]|uniref:larval cuticle protein 65Ag1-like n=1 Tax=Anopheles marshallii TaxID=1521116 RepID=UPI00237AB649|nr:larval cuticle protein 65Ag1-like [Anopheles marshallii]
MRVISTFFVLFVACAPFIAGAPTGEENGDLVRYENVQTENGYRFSYETKDGQVREEVGTIDPSTGTLTVTGWYSFRTPDGATHRVDFIADENGYRTMHQPGVVAAQLHPAPVAAAPINNALLLSLVG